MENSNKKTDTINTYENYLYDIAKYAAYFCMNDEDIQNELFSGKPTNIKCKQSPNEKTRIIECDCKYYVKKNEKIGEVKNYRINCSFTKNNDIWIMACNYKSNDKKSKDNGNKDGIQVKKPNVLTALENILVYTGKK